MCNAKHPVYAVIEKMEVIPVTTDYSLFNGISDRISVCESRYALGVGQQLTVQGSCGKASQLAKFWYVQSDLLQRQLWKLLHSPKHGCNL
jgi:hypothetical protein